MHTAYMYVYMMNYIYIHVWIWCMNDTNTLHTPSPITTPLPHCLPTRCRLSPHHPHLSITTRLTMIIRGGARGAPEPRPPTPVTHPHTHRMRQEDEGIQLEEPCCLRTLRSSRKTQAACHQLWPRNLNRHRLPGARATAKAWDSTEYNHGYVVCMEGQILQWVWFSIIHHWGCRNSSPALKQNRILVQDIHSRILQ